MDVQIVGTGFNENIEQQVEATFQASRATLRPLDYVIAGVIGGHYSAAFPTGSVTGRTAADVILGFRWASSTKLCVVKRIAIATTVITAGSGMIQIIDYQLNRVTSFTTNYVTGATKQAFIATGNKLRTTMASTEFVNYGDVYAATTGAATGQTATVDTIGTAYLQLQPAPVAAYVGSLGMAEIWKQDKMGGHPLIFTNGEGFNITVGTTQGATVAVKSVFTVEWAEVTVY